MVRTAAVSPQDLSRFSDAKCRPRNCRDADRSDVRPALPHGRGVRREEKRRLYEAPSEAGAQTVNPGPAEFERCYLDGGAELVEGVVDALFCVTIPIPKPPMAPASSPIIASTATRSNNEPF